EWQNIRIKRRQIEFAWGPTDDRVLRKFSSMEFVISAGAEGGAGQLWFDRLALKTVERPQTVEAPAVTASSARKGHDPAFVLDDKADTSWRSVRRAGQAQQLTIDLKQVKEFGGIEIDWLKDLYATQYTIDLSLDGREWKTVRTVKAGNGGRDSHLLPESEARWIRLTMSDPGRELGISSLHIRDLEFGASANAFVRALAKDTKRGCYPRAFYDEQSYWTIVGVDRDSQEALFSEDGAIESHKSGFSVEPFIKVGSESLSWADAKIGHSLAEGYLPIPSVEWTRDDVSLKVTSIAAGAVGDAQTRVTYEVKNPTALDQRITLALMIRPFQVNPPAQFLNTPGGVSPIQDLSWKDARVFVDGITAVIPRSAPTSFVIGPSEAGSACDWTNWATGSSVSDETGFATGALLFDLDIAAGAAKEVSIDLPQHAKRSKPVAALADTDVEAAAREWQEKLNRVQFRVPADGQAWVDTLRTALAHVLINSDGTSLQPGSRSYERSWIRDGAMTSDMLLRLGHPETAKDFLSWYADYQFANGKIPCCVDVRGADPVPENDSGGEFLFLVDEVYRYTNDRVLLELIWPRVVKAVEYMEQLRASERTDANRQGDRRGFYGLMPASISHEGYSAKPMHSYWDNFWALTGYEAAVRIARVLDDKTKMREFIAARDQFRSDVYRSLQVAMQTHKIDYLPGAAELGDFDATSTSIALSPGGEQQMLPPDALQATFERYWREFDRRRTDQSWDAYTPYELRNLGTFVRLGWRDRAQELLQFFMNDRRPPEWNQWAEVVGREPRKTRFVGDMPHGWVASDYARSLLDMFAYERPMDETLVLMAGIPANWIDKDGFAVTELRTPYGPLSYSFDIRDDVAVLEIQSMPRLPAGGVAVSWPKRPAGKGNIQSGSGRWVGDELRIGKLPFRMEFTH
ncbi:MAG: discoidin domain-containing protein, partial [Povalibacter sp.]